MSVQHVCHSARAQPNIYSHFKKAKYFLQITFKPPLWFLTNVPQVQETVDVLESTFRAGLSI